MTTAANMKTESCSGQSVLEFILMLPIMLGLAMLMIRVNTVIQMGIVNQQYARAQALFVSGNGAEYPRREDIIGNHLAPKGFNQLVIGVSEEAAPADDVDLHQSATTYRIVPNTVNGFNDAPQEEALQRGNLRIRSSITLCLPSVTSGGVPLRPFTLITSDTQVYNLSDNPKQFVFCSASQTYDDDSGGQETI